jgi:hypothetical protein
MNSTILPGSSSSSTWCGVLPSGTSTKWRAGITYVGSGSSSSGSRVKVFGSDEARRKPSAPTSLASACARTPSTRRVRQCGGGWAAERLGVGRPVAARHLGCGHVHGVAERLAALLGTEVALVATPHVHAHQPAQLRAAAAAAATVAAAAAAASRAAGTASAQ